MSLKDRSQAYQEGFRYCRTGKSIHHNPYKGKEAEEWDRGWQDCCKIEVEDMFPGFDSDWVGEVVKRESLKQVSPT